MVFSRAAFRWFARNVTARILRIDTPGVTSVIRARTLNLHKESVDSAVQKSTVRDRKLQGRLFLSKGKIYQRYRILPAFSI